MVFYRKYRPQTIDDLDNAKVRETLFSVLKSSPSHAFLFTGPKGLGKTSTARIVAKVVNCVRRGDSIEPCNECEQCTTITNGTNMDIFEIDAASNRGIDEIRDLKEKIRLAPLSAAKKVYIIDEVHMLTTEAFNALLKTLEEPPPHAMFILCTTEAHKLPATIISRCMHLHFTPATEDELVRSFKRIVTEEKISITDDALVAIAQMSDRGFRDGAKMLEEVVLLAQGKEITKELLEEKYQVAGIAHLISELLTLLKKKNAPASLELVKKSVEQGIDTKYVIQQLIEALHGLLLVRITQNKTNSSEFTLEEIKELIDLLSKAHQEIKYAVLPQLPLELAIIEYCQKPNVIARSEATKQSLADKQEGVTVTALRKQVGDIKKNHALYGEPKKVKEETSARETSTVELMHVPQGELTQEWQDLLWKNIIVEMKQYNHTIAGVLRSCSIGSYDTKTLIIQTKFPFHKERLDDKKTQEALVKVCKLLTGKEVEVKVELRK